MSTASPSMHTFLSFFSFQFLIEFIDFIIMIIVYFLLVHVLCVIVSDRLFYYGFDAMAERRTSL